MIPRACRAKPELLPALASFNAAELAKYSSHRTSPSLRLSRLAVSFSAAELSVRLPLHSPARVASSSFTAQVRALSPLLACSIARGPGAGPPARPAP